MADEYDVSWENWPQWLTDRAKDATEALQTGRPETALSTLDAMIADIDARRQDVADIANRHFEPSTDDRQP